MTKEASLNHINKRFPHHELHAIIFIIAKERIFVMKQAVKRWNQTFRRVNWIIVAVVLVLSYGFVMTNPSIGIDDENFDYFYKNNGMMVAGRWGYWLLAKIFDTYAYLPVWRETLAIICLVIAAVLFVCICECVMDAELSRGHATAVVSMIIAYPLIARMFVYMNNCLEVTGGILFATLAAYALVCVPRKRDVGNVDSPDAKTGTLARLLPSICAAAFLLIGCAQIENTLITFYVEICLFAYLKKDKDNLWHDILYPVVLSVIAMLLSQGIGRILAWVVGVNYSSYGMGVYGRWDQLHSAKDVAAMLATWKDNYVYWFGRYFSVKLFMAAVVFWLGAGIWQFAHKRICKGLYAIGVIVASFTMYLITANGALPIRIFTVYFVAVAGCTVCVAAWIQAREVPEAKSGESVHRTRRLDIYRGLFYLACVICVFYGTKESNLHFREDYKRYERDVDVARNVNYDLEKLAGRTPGVPVIFLGQPEAYGDMDPRGEFALESIYSNNEQGQSIRIHQFFRMLGYNYPDVLTEEITPNNLKTRSDSPLIEEAREESLTMPVYPYDGYIRVMEDKIIVKLGE